MLKNIAFSVIRESLFRNSLFLMLSTAIMAGLGFFFWLINAHLFETAEIGHATTLLASMSMISVLSLIGFDSVYVRFLPKEEDRNANMNTGLVLVALASFLFSSIYVVAVQYFVPELSFVSQTPWIAFLFVIATVISSLNTLTDAIFISQRRTIFILIINATFSSIKMLLPFAFISYGAMGIFIATAVAQAIGLVLSIVVLMSKCGFRPRFSFNVSVLKRVWRYSSISYFAGILTLLPSSIVPLLILSHLGPEQAAYYYIATMIAGLLYVIPNAATNSLFAESSNEESSHDLHVWRTLQICAFFLTPGILVVLLGSPLLLSVFGHDYATGATQLLRILALNSIAVAGDLIFIAIFRFTKDLTSLFIVNAFYAVGVIGLSFMLIPWGLIGIGIAYLAANILCSAVGLTLYRVRQPSIHIPHTTTS